MGRRMTFEGHTYRLDSVGSYPSLRWWALEQIPKFGWCRIDPDIKVNDEIYHFAWYVNAPGSPYLVRLATPEEIDDWDELVDFYIEDEPALLWVRVKLPDLLICEGPCSQCDEKMMEVWE